MEVGPLARYVLGYAHALKDNPHGQRGKEQLEGSLRAVNLDLPKALGLEETNLSDKQLLPSTIGRTLTRALEAEYCAEMMVDDWNELMTNIRNGDRATANVEKWDPSTWPAEAKGRRHRWPRHAARWATGSGSRTGGSRTTSASCPAPGTPARATTRARSARLKPP